MPIYRLHRLRLCGLLLLTAFIPALLSGCQTALEDTEDADAPVTIAYVDEWHGSGTYYLTTLLDQYARSHPDTAISPQPFSSHDAFAKQISTELAAGNGPDILLLDDYTRVNWQKLALNDRLAGLSAYMEADEGFMQANYFEAALTAGQLNGEQYIFPLSFKCACFCTTQEKLAQNNLSAGTYTYKELLGMLNNSVRSAQTDPERIPIVLDIDDTYYLVPLLRAFQVPTADLRTGEVLLPEDILREVCDYLKLLNETRPIAENRKKLMDYAYQSENYPHIDCYFRTYGFPTWLGFHQLMMEYAGETSQVLLAPSCTVPGARTATLSFYGAVSSDSRQKTRAYTVLRELADSASGEGIGWDFPASRAAFQEWLDREVVGTFPTAKIDGNVRTVSLTQEYADHLMAAAESVSCVTAESRDVLEIVDKCMLPYIEGSGDFDDCYRQAVNKLRLYVNE